MVKLIASRLVSRGTEYEIVHSIGVILFGRCGNSAMLAVSCRGLCCQGEKWSVHTKGAILSGGKRKEGIFQPKFSNFEYCYLEEGYLMLIDFVF